MAAFLDVCRYSPTAGGTTDWTFSSAITGYQSPSAAGVVNGRAYKYRAESADLSQWEIGEGTYNTGTGVLTRTTVFYNSSGTTSKINFTLTPQVAIVPVKEDLLSIEEANAFTATQRAQARTNISAALKGQIWGLTLSAAGGTGTFGIAAGEAADSTGVDLMALASAYTKTTAAWAVGTGNGALDTGAIAASTWYHAYEIKRPDTGVVDCLVSLSATAPTLPSNYTLFRRIGSMKTDGSSFWSKFNQQDDTFLWDADDAGAGPVINVTPGVTTAVSRVVTVPLGVKVIALLRALISGTGGAANLLLTSLDVSDQVATSTLSAAANSAGSGNVEVQVRTDTSKQIRTRVSTTTASIYITTSGWIDTRGRLG